MMNAGNPHTIGKQLSDHTPDASVPIWGGFWNMMGLRQVPGRERGRPLWKIPPLWDRVTDQQIHHATQQMIDDVIGD